MTVLLHNGVVADNPVNLTDRIRISVPDLTTMPRRVYGPLRFDPIVSGYGGTRLPRAGDRAVVGVDEGTGEQWVVSWHRDDTTPPPYSELGGGAPGIIPESVMAVNIEVDGEYPQRPDASVVMWLGVSEPVIGLPGGAIAPVDLWVPWT
jgi:hypothetical protein